MVNLLQCRPLQTKGQQAHVQIPPDLQPDDILIRCQGYFMGGSVSTPIHRIIYVHQEAYVGLPLSQKYDVARLIGLLNRQVADREHQRVFLLGPGRWGTTTPSLGVPVHFSEINNMTVLGEVAYEGGNLMPELSFGTHFFQDLVENDTFYVAVFPHERRCTFDREWFDNIPNELADILPDKAKYADVVRVHDFRDRRVRLMSDVRKQDVVCFFERPGQGKAR